MAMTYEDLINYQNQLQGKVQDIGTKYANIANLAQTYNMAAPQFDSQALYAKQRELNNAAVDAYRKQAFGGGSQPQPVTAFDGINLPPGMSQASTQFQQAQQGMPQQGQGFQAPSNWRKFDPNTMRFRPHGMNGQPGGMPQRQTLPMNPMMAQGQMPQQVMPQQMPQQMPQPQAPQQNNVQQQIQDFVRQQLAAAGIPQQ